MVEASLEQLIARFTNKTLQRRDWTHRAHLQVGAWHVHHLGVEAALIALRSQIRGLNERHGTPNSTTQGYHETITSAYVRLISDFLATFDPSVPLEQRVTLLIASPLAERDFLLRHWSLEVLMSPAARASWVPPDRAPLESLSCGFRHK